MKYSVLVISILMLSGLPRATIAQEVPGGDTFENSIANSLALSNLGYMYQMGNGVKQDYLKALKFYRMAADHGDAYAQNALGNMYLKSQGVPQDYFEALKWYRKAAEQGNSGGQFNLGAMYANGYGTALDNVEAEKWFRKAADQGNAEAKAYLEQRRVASTTSKIVTLNCTTTSQYGGSREDAVAIDYTNMQVNGNKADFYENEIRWSAISADGSFYFRFALNRLSGFINLGSDQNPMLRTGHCAPASKQF